MPSLQVPEPFVKTHLLPVFPQLDVLSSMQAPLLRWYPESHDLRIHLPSKHSPCPLATIQDLDIEPQRLVVSASHVLVLGLM